MRHPGPAAHGGGDGPVLRGHALKRLRALLLALGPVVWVAALVGVWHRAGHRPTTAAVDILPLWLGAQALLVHLDPNDPAVQERLFRAAHLAMHPGGFWDYYPPTAHLWFLPVAHRELHDVVDVWRPLALVLLGLSGWLASGRRLAGAWVGAALLATRPVWMVLPAGQPSPLVVFLTALGLALAARRPTAAGVVFGLGVGVKLLPLAVVPGLVVTRRWRALGALFVAALLPMVAVLVLVPTWSAGVWAARLAEFVNPGGFPPWNHEPGWLRALWSARLLGPAPATIGLLVLVGAKRVVPPSLPALLLSWVGLGMAGSQLYHEALVLLPAVAWALGRGGCSSIGMGVLLVAARVWDPTTAPNALHWVAVGWGTWGVLAAATWSESFRAPRPAPAAPR